MGKNAHAKERMKVVIALVAIACVALYTDAAPIDGDQLIQNIETAAEDEAMKAQTIAGQMEAQAQSEQETIEANKQFAGAMSSEIKADTMDLKEMKAEEQETIADAEAIKADVGTQDVQDIEAKDQDASQTSEMIQSTAEKLDDKLKAAIDKMEGVGITKKAKKVASLGERQDFPSVDESGSYQQQLQNVEEQAHEMVDQAEAAEKAAESKKQAADDTLARQANMAKTGMAQLKKAEAQLHRDLNGHRDAQLEGDIEQKAEDIEAQQTKLGESQTPLEAAEAAAEAAMGNQEAAMPSEPEEAAAADPYPEDYAAEPSMAAADFSGTASGEAAPALRMPPTSTIPAEPAMATDSVSADYSTISSDADQLKSYQETSINEIKQIQEPLSR